MANTISDEALAILRRRTLDVPVVKTATMTLADTSTVDISSLVLSWGQFSAEVMGLSPSKAGNLVFTLASLQCKNGDGYFDIGGDLWATKADPERTSLEITFTLIGETLLWWSGILDQPHYDHDSGIVTLGGEHLLIEARHRIWKRADRIGGYTGYKKTYT